MTCSPALVGGEDDGVGMHDGQLIELIYELAEEEDCWQRLLPIMSAALAAPRSHIFILDGERIDENHSHAISEITIRRYHAEFQGRDPRINWAERHLGRVFSDVEIVDEKQWENSSIYNDLLIYDESRYTMFVNLPVQAGIVAAQAFMRSKEEGHFTRDDVARFERLLPHIGRAVRLRRAFSAMRTELHGLRAALDRLPTAMAVLDGVGRVVCLNARGEQLVERRHMIVHGHRLTSSSPRTASAMAVAIKATAQLVEPGVVAGTPPPPVVEVVRDGAPPLSLIFLPLHPHHRLRQDSDANARVLVVVHDPVHTMRLDVDVVAKLHGLTATEASLAVALAEGQSAAEIAEARHSSEHTVRTHLKRILEKTGTHRQADLVRVLLSSSASHLSTSTLPPRGHR